LFSRGGSQEESEMSSIHALKDRSIEYYLLCVTA
jgi:hypothetical protein